MNDKLIGRQQNSQEMMNTLWPSKSVLKEVKERLWCFAVDG